MITLLALAAAIALPSVDVKLVVEPLSIRPGEPFTAGLLLETEKGWHTYWRNPGDSGQATSLRWQLPAGFRAEELRWPLPRRFEGASGVSFGYEGKVLLTAQVHPPRELKPGGVARLAGTARWVACREVCVPGKAAVSTDVPVAAHAAEADPHWRAEFEASREAVPVKRPEWRTSAKRQGSRGIVLTVRRPAKFSEADAGGVLFFPAEAGVVDLMKPARARAEGGALVVELPPPVNAVKTRRLHGVLVVAGAPVEIDVKF